ncbi:MAG: iron-sulfur cluster assembly accessory protein, partial [Oceanipulchritudo sp.]
MIRITERAIEAIGKLAKERAEPGQRLRVSIKSGGCSGLEYAMEFTHPESTDETFEQDGLTYLVEKRSLDRLQGSEIDF